MGERRSRRRKIGRRRRRKRKRRRRGGKEEKGNEGVTHGRRRSWLPVGIVQREGEGEMCREREERICESEREKKKEG